MINISKNHFSSPKSWHFRGTPQKSQQCVRWKKFSFSVDEGDFVPGHLWPYSRRLGLFGQPAANNDHLTSHSSWASVAYQNPLWRVKFTSVIYLDFLKDACILNQDSWSPCSTCSMKPAEGGNGPSLGCAVQEEPGHPKGEKWEGFVMFDSHFSLAMFVLQQRSKGQSALINLSGRPRPEKGRDKPGSSRATSLQRWLGYS